MPTATTVTEMSLDGGVACLDFVNSGLDTEKDTPVERLHTYHDLLVLAERLALFDSHSLKALKKLADANQEEAQRNLIVARQVRQVMFKVFIALAHGKLENLDKKILTKFNEYVNAAISSQAFQIEGTQLIVAQKEQLVNLKQPVWAFVLSAYELLRDKDQQYIKQCDGCEWLFMDETKNHRRKWCDMQSCGSIEKSKRYYQKKKKLVKD